MKVKFDALARENRSFEYLRKNAQTAQNEMVGRKRSVSLFSFGAASYAAAYKS
jgi:hypothetical protein